jgi:hypothetical protein
MSFYIMYKLYHNENVTTTYAEGIVLKTIQRLKSSLQSVDVNFKAEQSLLNDILHFIPKVGSKKVREFIEESESMGDQLKELHDINQYLRQYQEKMPILNGVEKFAVPGTLRDYETDDDLPIPPL